MGLATEEDAVRVAVLIPSYNHGRYVAEAIESVLAQTRAPDEIVVVDDGSTDDSVAILQRYGERIRLYTQPNAGIGATYNRLLGETSADIVAFLESDDVLEPHYLEVCLRALREQGVAWVSTARMVIDSAGAPTGRVLGKRSPGTRYTTESMLGGDLGFAYTPVVRTDALRDVGWFDTDYSIGADSEISLRFSTRHPMGYVETPLYRYRLHGANVSDGALRDSEEVLEILRRFRESEWARRHPAAVRKGLARLAGRVASLRVRSGRHATRSEALAWFAEAYRLDPWNVRNLRRYLTVRWFGPQSLSIVRRRRSDDRTV